MECLVSFDWGKFEFHGSLLNCKYIDSVESVEIIEKLGEKIGSIRPKYKVLKDFFIKILELYDRMIVLIEDGHDIILDDVILDLQNEGKDISLLKISDGRSGKFLRTIYEDYDSQDNQRTSWGIMFNYLKNPGDFRKVQPDKVLLDLKQLTRTAENYLVKLSGKKTSLKNAESHYGGLRVVEEYMGKTFYPSELEQEAKILGKLDSRIGKFLRDHKEHSVIRELWFNFAEKILGWTAFNLAVFISEVNDISRFPTDGAIKHYARFIPKEKRKELHSKQWRWCGNSHIKRAISNLVMLRDPAHCIEQGILQKRWNNEAEFRCLKGKKINLYDRFVEEKTGYIKNGVGKGVADCYAKFNMGQLLVLELWHRWPREESD